ncbi:hypothetical protein N9O61_01950 [Octadecabacter sp.]|nr:hypothetical protein [Octadecabacter sp.]
MLRWLVPFCLIFFVSNAVSAQTLSRIETTEAPNGTTIEFLSGEFVGAVGIDYPRTGWQSDDNPNIDVSNRLERGKFRTMAGRYFFERGAIGDDFAAIYMMNVRGNFSVTLNGQELFRNYADPNEQRSSWNRPILIPVPDGVLKSDLNEIIVHSFTRKTAGIGRVIIGSNDTLEVMFKQKLFSHITAPMAANFAMLVLGFFVFLIWIGRRQEIELLWFSVSTVLWFMRNHQYYTAEIPFDVTLYFYLTFYPTYFAVTASAAFYFHFIKLPNRNLIVTLIFFVGVVIVVAHITLNGSSLILYLPTTIVVFIMSAFAMRDIWRHRNMERGILAGAILLLPLIGLHDLNLLLFYEGTGETTYLAVFCGVIFAVAFLVSFGKRALDAFSDLEKSKLILEQSIEQTRAELEESEAIRQELLVGKVIADERGRLMQEMHDGIGSNLTTALAVARQQNQSEGTVKVLSRALGDLKLTVDSLEPIEGDLVALIGNLRHRVSRDLAEAGITCTWEVEDCQPLTWLDATNALHVLRIHSEVISNVLAHSNATAIRIGCIEAFEDGKEGISTYIDDNGDGFDPDVETSGKGLVNIRGRAHSLHGKLTCTSHLGKGTIITLWLPYNPDVSTSGP